MAKKKAASQEGGLSARDIMAQALHKEHKNKRDRSLYMLPGDDAVQLGLACPFVLEYLFDCGCLPLGVLMEVNGAQESCKTMFMYELGRMFADSDGWLEMALTEQKFSPTLARSIMGWERRHALAGPYMCEYMDDMQSILMERVNAADELAEKGIDGSGPLGHSFPVLFGADSLMGANMKEKSDKIEKQGHAGRSFASEALSLTDYLKHLASKLSNKPYLGLLIRHRKETPGATAYEAPTVSKPGGKHVGYQVSYELILKGVSQKKQANVDGDGSLDIEHRWIRITNGKNSAGTNKNKAVVRVSWRKKVIQGVVRQFTKWHWEEALVGLLMDWQEAKLDAKGTPAGRKQKMDEFFHIRKERGPVYWSSTLGMTKDDAVSQAKMGAMIQSNPDVIAALRQMFGIQQSYIWDREEDYNKALRSVQSEAAKTAKDTIDSDLAREEFSRATAEMDDETFTR